MLDGVINVWEDVFRSLFDFLQQGGETLQENVAVPRAESQIGQHLFQGHVLVMLLNGLFQIEEVVRPSLRDSLGVSQTCFWKSRGMLTEQKGEDV